MAVRNSLLERFSCKFRRCWKMIPRFSGSAKCYPCQGLGGHFPARKTAARKFAAPAGTLLAFSSETATAFLSSSELKFMKGRPTQKKTPTQIKTQFAQTISGQFVQTVPPLSFKTSRKEAEEFAQTVCANCLCKLFLFGWVVLWVGRLPLLNLRRAVKIAAASAGNRANLVHSGADTCRQTSGPLLPARPNDTSVKGKNFRPGHLCISVSLCLSLSL